MVACRRRATTSSRSGVARPSHASRRDYRVFYFRTAFFRAPRLQCPRHLLATAAADRFALVVQRAHVHRKRSRRLAGRAIARARTTTRRRWWRGSASAANVLDVKALRRTAKKRINGKITLARVYGEQKKRNFFWIFVTHEQQTPSE